MGGFAVPGGCQDWTSALRCGGLQPERQRARRGRSSPPRVQRFRNPRLNCFQRRRHGPGGRCQRPPGPVRIQQAGLCAAQGWVEEPGRGALVATDQRDVRHPPITVQVRRVVSWRASASIAQRWRSRSWQVRALLFFLAVARSGSAKVAASAAPPSARTGRRQVIPAAKRLKKPIDLIKHHDLRSTRRRPGRRRGPAVSRRVSMPSPSRYRSMRRSSRNTQAGSSQRPMYAQLCGAARHRCCSAARRAFRNPAFPWPWPCQWRLFAVASRLAEGGPSGTGQGVVQGHRSG